MSSTAKLKQLNSLQLFQQSFQVSSPIKDMDLCQKSIITSPRANINELSYLKQKELNQFREIIKMKKDDSGFITMRESHKQKSKAKNSHLRSYLNSDFSKMYTTANVSPISRDTIQPKDENSFMHSQRNSNSKVAGNLYEELLKIVNSPEDRCLESSLNALSVERTIQSLIKNINRDTKVLLKYICKKYSTLSEHYSEYGKTIKDLKSQNEGLNRTIASYQKTLQNITKNLSPYQNSVKIMESQLISIKQALKRNQFITAQSSKSIKTTKRQSLKSQSIFQQSFNNQQLEHEQNINKLIKYIDTISQENSQLKDQVIQLTSKNDLFRDLLNQAQRNSQYRQLYHMTTEELLHFKIQNQKLIIKNQKLEKSRNRLNYKINMLASLVGYGVISQVKIDDNDCIKSFMTSAFGRKDGYDFLSGTKLTADYNGLSCLPELQVSIKSMIEKQQSSVSVPFCKTIFQPNYIVFLNQNINQITQQISESSNDLIKPEFFSTLRAILDCKYTQSHIYGLQSLRFPEFVETFLTNFRVKNNYKRIILYTNIINNSKEIEVLKVNFLLKMVDIKIAKLPQVITFREFLLKGAMEDQIYYYLACRKLIHNGAQLNSCISVSDPYVYVSYQHAKTILLLLLDGYDRKVKDTIFSNINAKKVTKGKNVLIKPSYIIRLLLQLYRKVKERKIVKLKDIFESVYNYSRLPVMKFIHFNQLLQTNFDFLSFSDIANMYRKTVATFHQNVSTTFFECFHATCIEKIFFLEVRKWEDEIQAKLTTITKDLKNNREILQGSKNKLKSKQEPIAQFSQTFKHKEQLNELSQSKQQRNFLLQLYPEAVYQQGSEILYKRYISLLKKCSKKQMITQAVPTTFTTKIQILDFLLKMIEGHITRNPDCSFKSSTEPLEKRTSIIKSAKSGQIDGTIESTIQLCIDWLNSKYQQRQLLQSKMQDASKIIGKTFRKKIYEFYEEFILDINKEIVKNKQNPSDRKSGRFLTSKNFDI